MWRRLLFWLLLFGLVASASGRTWHDSSGKFSTEAELLECKGGYVYLQKDNGDSRRVPLDQLSPVDQEYVTAAFPPVKTIVGKVVSVTDGDTLTVLDRSKQQYKIRLEGIDAPESSQAFGTQAKTALSAKVFQKNVSVEWREKDKYGRTLGDIVLNSRWINHELVEEGWAWHYKQFSKSKMLAEAQTRAMGLAVGLWSDTHAIPPWDFRKTPTVVERPKVAEKPTPATTAEEQPKQNDDPIVYVTRTGTKYHRSGCRYLRKSSIPIPLSEAAKRYSPCSVCNPPRP